MTSMKQESPRHTQILEAAMRVFETRGYAQTTMDAVAGEAGVSKGSIYNYFSSKQVLFASVLEIIVQGEEDQFLSVIRSDLTAAEKISRLLDLWAQGVPRLAPLARVVLESWALASREEGADESLAFFRKAYSRWHEWIAEIIQQGIDEGDFASDIRPELGAAVFLAALDGLKVQILFEVGLEFSPELMKGWREGFLAALRAGPETRSEDSEHQELENA